ncbi:MAG TPA: 6-carboxytetrahydropterin synthase [Bacteroidales bacterium]|nr:6-carboxytetrahydropterin synthase [Bacteroidales bacterium]
MTLIRVTKKFDFEMAHALYEYDGLCRTVHGHSYKLDVTVIGTPISEKGHKKLGMVIDFSDFKKIVKELIVDVYDHSLVISHWENLEALGNNRGLFHRVHVVDYQPTCENMIVHFAKILKQALPDYISLHSIKMHETANSFAEWFASDQN